MISLDSHTIIEKEKIKKRLDFFVDIWFCHALYFIFQKEMKFENAIDESNIFYKLG